MGPAALGSVAATVLVLLSVLVLVTRFADATRTVKPSVKPSVLIFLADDLGYGEINQHAPEWGFPKDALSPGGGAPVKRPIPPLRTLHTPNAERLARQGLRLTMSYAPSSVCGPSRAAMLAERQAGLISARSNTVLLDAEFIEPNPLAEDLKMFGGYKTGYFGKWGLGKLDGGPWNHGFDYFVGQLTHKEGHYPFPEYMTRYDASKNAKPTTHTDVTALEFPILENKGTKFAEATCPLDVFSPCVYSNDIFRDEALKFISNGANWPFFVIWSPTYPHAGMYKANSNGPVTSPVKRITPGRENTQNEKIRGHASQIEMHLDGDIGMLLDLFERNTTLGDNTFFVFTSDNGAQHDLLKGYSLSTFKSAGGLKGHKRKMHDGGLRIPSIVRFPLYIPRGRVSNVPHSLYDLGPTIREIAEIPEKRYDLAPEYLVTAKSMFSTWRYLNGTVPRRDFLEFELCPAKPFLDYECDAVIIDVRDYLNEKRPLYKLMVFNKRNNLFLYDLRNDPQEKKPIRRKNRPGIFDGIWNWRTVLRYALNTANAKKKNTKKKNGR